jgi:hypothetical protein
MAGRFETYDDPSVGELLGRLTEEGKMAVRSEIALYRSQVMLRVARAKGGVVLAIAAIMLVHLALIAAAVQITAALAAIIGGAWAALAVLVFGLVGGYVLIRLAVARIKPAFAPLDAPRS